MAQTTEQLSQVQDKLSFIQDMIDKGEYNIVITESCSLFEMAFKKIFKEAVASFEFQDRNALMEAEQKIGKGNKGVNDFGFGELVGLNRESHLLSKWATYTNKDMGLINSINFGSIEMGYDSGSAFGRVMNEKWELEDDLNIHDKITM